jgi:hypothetical protein
LRDSKKERSKQNIDRRRGEKDVNEEGKKRMKVVRKMELIRVINLVIENREGVKPVDGP